MSLALMICVSKNFVELISIVNLIFSSFQFDFANNSTLVPSFSRRVILEFDE